MKQIHVPRTWTDPLVQSKQWERDIRFGTWNVSNLCRAGSFTTIAREFAKCTLDLVGVQEGRCGKGGSVRTGDYITSRLKSGNACYHLVQNLLS